MLFSLWVILRTIFSIVPTTKQHSSLRIDLHKGVLLNEALLNARHDEWYKVEQLCEATEEWEKEIASKLPNSHHSEALK